MFNLSQVLAPHQLQGQWQDRLRASLLRMPFRSHGGNGSQETTSDSGKDSQELNKLADWNPPRTCSPAS